MMGARRAISGLPYEAGILQIKEDIDLPVYFNYVFFKSSLKSAISGIIHWIR